MLSASEPVPWVLLSSSSLERGIGASRSKCVTATLAPVKRGRFFWEIEPLKSLSFPVSNLQSGWKPPLWRHPDAVLSPWSGDRGSRLGWHQQQDRLLAMAGAHCSIPVLTWKASPSPRVACCKGRDTGAHSTTCPRMKDHQHPPVWSCQGSVCPGGVPREARQGLWVQPGSCCTHPPTSSSCWRQVPTTLLISLCLSLLTISSNTSPSPLISLEDKHRPTSHEGYWQIPASHTISQPQKALTSSPPPGAAVVPQLRHKVTSSLTAVRARDQVPG